MREPVLADVDIEMDPPLVNAPPAREVVSSRELAEPVDSGWGINEACRPRVCGKFIFAGNEKLYVRGTTYGAFRPDASGREYHNQDRIEQDFAQMAAHGINAVRIPHTTPPRTLLDAAQRHGMRVMVGLSAEQYVGSLLDRKRSMSDIEKLVRRRASTCAGHPALLGYALGNEIPASLVRWIGRGWIERYLETLFKAVKSEDPDGLVTHVNYPTTEYLKLPFLDLVCLNVYLESQERLEAYLARLHNIAGNRPVVLSEIGLDSLRQGESVQARSLDWQIRTAFGGGCAGVFVFAWTDEWYANGGEMTDWKFGITDHERRPKLALAAVRRAFREVPFPSGGPWPRISVVVCSYNGSRTIGRCLQGLRDLDYPNFEVIVVDDGSTDSTAAIACKYDVQLICTPNRGLSHARNVGIQAATGEIVAYIDDDAWPDRHWLTYLAATFRSTRHAGVGGPNIAPPGHGEVADCVNNAPGGPVHVLLSDMEAEHLPGCNMAFRKESLKAIGGFDPRFRVAGDDVDICWRIRERGETLGFSPAAVVWHLRRGTVKGYWKQQFGYGKAEALLEKKWPEKYTGLGSATWAGRIYGTAMTRTGEGGRARPYYGVWGAAPFQSLYQPAPSLVSSLGLMPEWYLLALTLAALSVLGYFWQPLEAFASIFVLAALIPLIQAGVMASRASFEAVPASRFGRLKLVLLTASLHLLQPLARFCGRVWHGLTPWRRVVAGFVFPRPRVFSIWSARWLPPENRLQVIESTLREGGICVRRGGDFDRWDLESRAGMFGSARLLMAVEACGDEGGQLVRFRLWPRCSPGVLALGLLSAALSLSAAGDHAWVASGALGLTAGFLLLRTFLDCAASAAAFIRVFRQQQRTGDEACPQPATAM